MQAMIQAIANPNRRKILQLIWEEEMPARQIADNFAISWPAISQNLRVLKDAGLLIERRNGVQRLYRVNHEAAQPIEQMLKMMWQDDLATLKQIVEDDLNE